MNKAVKIVLTGPESVGKSTLTKQLADHFSVPFVFEIARTYIESVNRPYTKEDVLEIARRQIEEEKKFAGSGSELMFLDTDLVITKIWLIRVYGSVPVWIDRHLKYSPASLHLLCYPDLPWEYDPLRENPDARQELFDEYKQEIEALGIPYVIIKGEHKSRIKNAIEAVNAFLNR